MREDTNSNVVAIQPHNHSTDIAFTDKNLKNHRKLPFYLRLIWDYTNTGGK